MKRFEVRTTGKVFSSWTDQYCLFRRRFVCEPRKQRTHFGFHSNRLLFLVQIPLKRGERLFSPLPERHFRRFPLYV